jgi:hypothetical protein
MATIYFQRLLVFIISICAIASTAYAESGRTDYDLDDDGLIEINSLADLNEIRNNLDGTTLYGESVGCPAEGCNGFELTTTLDFDTNADGVMDQDDEYWNGGEGWEPIGSFFSYFAATFDGNGHQIRNLYIRHTRSSNAGLFGYVNGDNDGDGVNNTASLLNIGLTGELMSVTGTSSVGGLAGYVRGAFVSQSYSTGFITGQNSVGGLIGRVYYVSISNSFSTGRVTGNVRLGGLIGGVDSSSLKHSFSTGEVTGKEKFGGLVGFNSFTVFMNNHWASDTSGQELSFGESEIDNYFGATLAELQCPTSSDDAECLSGNTLYATWDNTVWDFGTNQELPGLIFNGVVFRDNDGDGSLDTDDLFPSNRAASVDSDNDGHPDAWRSSCDAECILLSGLTLDQFPITSAAWQDEDLDGYPDSWADDCDISCQNDSGLTLDAFPKDLDNDGVLDSQDNDGNNDGVVDADADSNGLIDVSTLEQLNAVRYNLNGAGRTLTEAGEIDSSGCPAVIFEGVLQRHCSGYELTTMLDFDTNADGVMDANDTYWNEGDGWEPIGDNDNPFAATFDGNGYQIRNLFIDRASSVDVGLFGYIQGQTASLNNIGLSGTLMSVTGSYRVGGLAGYIENAYVSQSYSTGVVTGIEKVGGLFGMIYYTSLSNSFSTGGVTGSSDIGGLVGYFYGGSLSHSFATGGVTDNPSSGGLLGVSTSPVFLSNNFWATDTTGQRTSADASLRDNYFGATLAELQCPTSIDNTECLVSDTLYATWDSTVWDFGTNQELPGLIINGVVFRDGDGDGSLDGDDAFPNNRAGSVDNDNDGYLDSWTLGCDAQCRSTSGLTLDQFPMTSAAWLDADLDGYPDSWAPNCDASCQSNSGLTLDTFINDVDNDGVIDSQDNDDNNDGIVDADADSNGLIDVSTLEQLNAVRYNLNGTGRTLTEAGESDSSGCPAVIFDGILQRHCSGYELTTTLDFDTNADGVMDENDTYWNEGYGWEPTGDQSSPFTATFNGNGHQIRNLYIDRPSTDYVGLLGYVKGETSSISSLGLTGQLMSVIGDDYVGGLAGKTENTSTSNSFVTGSVKGDQYIAGLVGYAANGSLINSFATGSVNGNSGVGGLVGYVFNGSLSHSFTTGSVNGNSGVGGLLGSATLSSSLTNNHWATDVSGQASSAGASDANNYFGAILAELQCPISSDDTECLVGNTLYASWDDAVWDFGSNQELPGLIIDGVVHRDGDGDGSLDGDDAFPNNRAGSVDNDNDGYLDSWTLGCDAQCRSTSGLALDQFPMTSAAWLDADLDGYPDSWASNCGASCQNESGLTLDTSLNDVDNDGIIDSEDSDTNGILNADANSNGLIDVSIIEQLNAVRYNLNGTGRTLTEAGESDSSGCPAVIFDGILQRHCSGYELTATLDFDTNADGVIDENDTYWNEGYGWQPIGDSNSPFSTVFDGDGHQIRNLYIDRPSTDLVGLFGYVEGETAFLRNLGLTGKLMSVIGDDYVGGLAGKTENTSTSNSLVTGSVKGDQYIGGLVGYSANGSFSNSFATGSVDGNSRVGGMVGYFFNGSLSNSFATGSVNGNSDVGGLLGSATFSSSLTNNHWATDSSGQVSSAGASNSNNYFGATLAELQCPTSSDDMECLVSNTLYATWDSTVWDFGTNQELPGLIINGIVYRDSDGDGALDINQAPEVTLVLKQDGDVVPDVIVGAGDVNIEAVITDPDVSDVHTLTWTLSDSSLMGETDNTSASFSSDNIPDGEYTVAVVATDNRYSPLSDDASITFTVERNASSPSIENTTENSTSSGSSGGGGALGVFWVLMLSGLMRLRSRRSNIPS